MARHPPATRYAQSSGAQIAFQVQRRRSMVRHWGEGRLVRAVAAAARPGRHAELLDVYRA